MCAAYAGEDARGADLKQMSCSRNLIKQAQAVARENVKQAALYDGVGMF